MGDKGAYQPLIDRLVVLVGTGAGVAGEGVECCQDNNNNSDHHNDKNGSRLTQRNSLFSHTFFSIRNHRKQILGDKLTRAPGADRWTSQSLPGR